MVKGAGHASLVGSQSSAAIGRVLLHHAAVQEARRDRLLPDRQRDPLHRKAIDEFIEKASKASFQLGDYWLSQRPGSANWYATYFDKRSRQTKRISLGTSDFQQPQLKLAELVTKKAELKNVSPVEMPLATVLIRYWDRHGAKVASHETQRFALKLWNEFWGEAMIADLSIPRKREITRTPMLIESCRWVEPR
jgi:hypothetical protein